MELLAAFQGVKGENKVVTAAASSAATSIFGGTKYVRLVNAGTAVAHVVVGTGSLTATTADTPVRGGSELILRKNESDTDVAYIRGEASDVELHIQPGEGGV